MRGQSRRLEALAIWRAGAGASRFTVRYACYAEEIGGDGPVADGDLCGTADRGVALKVMWVQIVPKGTDEVGSASS
jgi:hypothetical protein